MRRAPEIPAAAAGAGGASSYRIFGWHPNLVFVVLSIAAFMCCITMSMPQAHLVALCSDLGISPARGAAMLSILLAAAVSVSAGDGVPETVDPAQIPNYKKVTPTLAAAGQPTAEVLPKLGALGFKTVINLRMPNEDQPANERDEKQ